MDRIFSINSTGIGSLECYCKSAQLAQIIALFIKERKEYRAFKDLHELGYVRKCIHDNGCYEPVAE